MIKQTWWNCESHDLFAEKKWRILEIAYICLHFLPLHLPFNPLPLSATASLFYYLNSPILLPKLLFSSPFLSHNPGLLPGTLVWPTLHCFDSFLFGPASLWCGCVYVCALEKKRKQQWSYFSICEVFILSEEMLGFWVWIHGFSKNGDKFRCQQM